MYETVHTEHQARSIPLFLQQMTFEIRHRFSVAAKSVFCRVAFAPRISSGPLAGALKRCLLWGLPCIALAACGPLFREPRLLLEDIAAGHGPSDLKSTTVTPHRVPHEWRADGQLRQADLYRPADDVRARLVLVPGLVPQGKDDPRVTALAYSLARMGFAVLTPDMPGFHELRASPQNVQDIVEAVLELGNLDLRTSSPRAKVGIAGISYAAGPAILAAMEPRIAERVSFILSVGGYYDIEEAITYLTTGKYRRGPGSPWQEGEPNPWGKWTFLRSNAHLIEDSRDRIALEAMGERKHSDLDASIEDLAQDLGPEGRAVYDLIVNTDPDSVGQLIARLPEQIRRDFDSLNIANKDLSNLKAQLILVHGQDDSMIPSTESIKMAEHLGESQAKLYVVSHLAHVEFRGEPTLFDQFTLLRAVRRVLNMRM